MRAIDIHDAGKITTTGEAEEGSTHKHRFTHVYKSRASHVLSLDTIFCAWGILAAPGLDEPLNKSARRSRDKCPALADETDLLGSIMETL